MRLIVMLLFLLSAGLSVAQHASLKGNVTNEGTNETIPFASIILQDTDFGTSTDLDGAYVFYDVPAGVYNVEVSYVGFKKKVVYEVEISTSRTAFLNIPLAEATVELEGAQIEASQTANRDQAPLSVRRIGVNEVKRNPGGNRDISRAIRSLPGVASTTSFRNDIIVRGGAPNENRFYIDGIEIPNINHFSTQGSSGGPVGLINVDLIQTVDFYSAAFPANSYNALSSVMEIQFREGRSDRYALNAVVGSSDVGLTVDGPTGKKSSIIASARRSYLQYLFQALELPFLPTYNDFQFKWRYQPNDRNIITVLGLGAIDEFQLNLSLADSTSDSYESNRYLLDLLAVTTQWNYMTGVKWDHFNKPGRLSVILSRNMLNNRAYKYPDNDETQPKTFDYLSREAENKVRINQTFYPGNGWKASCGVTYEYAAYSNRTDQQVYSYALDSLIDFSLSSSLNTHFYGAFAQISKTMLNERLTLNAGIRADGSSYSASMSNPLDQLSPRVSASWQILPQLSWNTSAGVYYQRPAYTILGYRVDGELVNQSNNLKYIQCSQAATGVRYETGKTNTTFSLEGFYKQYNHYPLSIDRQISLANLGADFGVIGNEAVSSTSQGRAYGVEFLIQQRLWKGLYAILSYTYVRSEFSNGTVTSPSSWDSRNLISVTGGKKFKKNWEVGFRFLYSGGLPYTPYDEQASLAIPTWKNNPGGVLNYTELNTLRLKPNHQLDVRVDKKWFWKKLAIDLYLDIQNIYNQTTTLQPDFDVVRDAAGNPVEDPNNPGYYQVNYLSTSAGTVLPSIGLILEW
ncbi:MAG: TonB-dependent receptor [Flavobacteriales bacterium]|nr:TonB-dependent receptor [Flavobacteriales bacterium]